MAGVAFVPLFQQMGHQIRVADSPLCLSLRSFDSCFRCLSSFQLPVNVEEDARVSFRLVIVLHSQEGERDLH